MNSKTQSRKQRLIDSLSGLNNISFHKLKSTNIINGLPQTWSVKKQNKIQTQPSRLTIFKIVWCFMDKVNFFKWAKMYHKHAHTTYKTMNKL